MNVLPLCALPPIISKFWFYLLCNLLLPCLNLSFGEPSTICLLAFLLKPSETFLSQRFDSGTPDFLYSSRSTYLGLWCSWASAPFRVGPAVQVLQDGTFAGASRIAFSLLTIIGRLRVHRMVASLPGSRPSRMIRVCVALTLLGES